MDGEDHLTSWLWAAVHRHHQQLCVLGTQFVEPQFHKLLVKIYIYIYICIQEIFMVFKLQHPIGRQVLAGFPGAWLVLPPVCFFAIRLYTAGGLLSSHWASVWTTLDTNFSPDPNLTASKSHWRTFPLGKKSKLHEEKYYPKDLGEPKKYEYFTKSQLFWSRTRFEIPVYLFIHSQGQGATQFRGP